MLICIVNTLGRCRRDIGPSTQPDFPTGAQFRELRPPSGTTRWDRSGAATPETASAKASAAPPIACLSGEPRIFNDFAKSADDAFANAGDSPSWRAKDFALSRLLVASLRNQEIRSSVHNRHLVHEVEAKPARNISASICPDVAISLIGPPTTVAQAGKEAAWRTLIDTSDICPVIIRVPSFSAVMLAMAAG